MRLLLSGVCLVIAACGASGTNDLPQTELTETVSGRTFLTPETQALQDDDFANPGFLWVDQGKTLFEEGEASCASCHSQSTRPLEGVAAGYPAYEEESSRLLNLEGRINTCRERHQDKPALPYESDALLGLTSYVAHLSKGLPTHVEIDGDTQANFEAGEAYFYTRRGQLNLSCSQCHNDNWGKSLRGDTISQGHGNGFPAYRLEWQTLGSLHRRLSDCDTGVRAEPLPLGSQTYIDLELYLANRAEGLDIETPAVRR